MPTIGRPIIDYKINQKVRIMYQKPFGLLRQEKILILLVMVVFILPGAFASSVAAEEKTAESGWEFTVVPYL